jgi:hypothetical protein
MPWRCTALEHLDDDHATAAAWTSRLTGIDGGSGGLAFRFCSAEQLTRACDAVSASVLGEQAVMADAVQAFWQHVGILGAIEDGMYQPAMKDSELEQQKAEIEKRLAEAPADVPDVHPNIAEHYRAKVIRLAETLAEPESNGEARETSVR